MDLHVYRNSQDRWFDLRSAARERGAVLAVNAMTVEEVVERLTPDVKTASAGQRVAVLERGLKPATTLNFTRYAYDAIAELKGARMRASELRSAGAAPLAEILEQYEDGL